MLRKKDFFPFLLTGGENLVRVHLCAILEIRNIRGKTLIISIDKFSFIQFLYKIR